VSESWADEADQAEIPLAGGDVTEGVVRVGNTVRRPVGPHSPLVHALLAHLEYTGFTGAPRFLGIDGSGREVLSYIDGEVAGQPRPPWIADEARLAYRAETLGGGWQRMRDEGVGDVIKRRGAWLEQHAATLTAALTAP
jgi:hypothetical protein